MGPGFWAEPWNAVSNAAFLLAALWGWIEARRTGAVGGVTLLLIALAALIGVGSFLFHSFATAWSGLADVLPIWSFVAVAVIVGMARVGGLAPARIAVIALAVVLALVLLVVAVTLPGGDQAARAPTKPPVLNGSLQYTPAVVALVAFSAMAWRSGHPLAGWIVAATVTFLLSLTFRTIDLAVCNTFSRGTHFLWHLLNGLMIGLVLQVLVRAERLEPRQHAGRV
ncbi:ceramidase domain-containing protein [Marimonas arenosa]|uniref:Ceramidase domain-containing protein n=3 Tax=Pseudomonadati TaxID=3379134 RepID=A0AAE4B5P3_9RHOB|nr:ceramidase domain-containing protein [Marimonas arenosa]